MDELLRVFPRLKFERDLEFQLKQAEMELEEVRTAGNKQEVLYELLDVANAVVNAIYMQGFTPEEIEAGVDYCIEKNRVRGYY